MRAMVAIGVLILLMTSLAGCAGDFRVRQTEPIKVQVDGGSREGRVAAADEGSDAPEKQEFELEEMDPDVEVVTVVVEVRRAEEGRGMNETTQSSPTGAAQNVSAGPVVVQVIVEDQDDGQRLAERRLEASELSAQTELDVDVKGRDNIVVIAQAIDGVAEVNVSATTEGGNMTASPSPTATATTYA